MTTPEIYPFPARAKASSYIKRWILLTVATLAVSGIAPLILLAGRASMFAEKAMIKTSFLEALVVHVDLSVLAWFLGITMLFWALSTNGKKSFIPYVGSTSLVTFAAGCLVIALSPMMGGGEALQSNYIPVYTSPLFFLGLGLLASSIVLALITLLTTPKADALNPFFRVGVLGNALIVLLALLHFAWACMRVDPSLAGSQDYYETLFWAGGHILQLSYTQLLLLAWIWLAYASGSSLIMGRLSSRVLYCILLVYPLVALASPLAFLVGNSQPYDFLFFTLQMRGGGGIACIALGAMVLIGVARTKKRAAKQKLPLICLLTSVTVFFTGGLIAQWITESNTIIPAHYHGSIVGTTLAFMGVIYLLLPRVGFADISNMKLSKLQPLLYGGGSVMHAVGLAWAGGYGVARKTPGALDAAHSGAELALQVMRLGGALAVIGGALFVVQVIRSIRRAKKVSA